MDSNGNGLIKGNINSKGEKYTTFPEIHGTTEQKRKCGSRQKQRHRQQGLDHRMGACNDPLQIWGFLSCKSGDFSLQLCPFLFYNKQASAALDRTNRNYGGKINGWCQFFDGKIK